MVQAVSFKEATAAGFLGYSRLLTTHEKSVKFSDSHSIRLKIASTGVKACKRMIAVPARTVVGVFKMPCEHVTDTFWNSNRASSHNFVDRRMRRRARSRGSALCRAPSLPPVLLPLSTFTYVRILPHTARSPTTPRAKGLFALPRTQCM